MATNLNDLLKLSRSQLNGYKKEQILDILEAADSSDGNGNIQTLISSIANLTTEITSLKTSMSEHNESNRKQIDELNQRVSKQDEIIAKQQLYVEQLDRKERECNLIILGVPEDNETLEGATNDIEKINKVWETAGISCNFKSTRCLGKPGGPRSRPILAEVDSWLERDTALDKAKGLKSSNKEAYKRIFIKKDVHPSVRAEWTRLHEVVKKEKERPGSSDSNIRLDFKERKVYRDGVVIDQWNMSGF